MPKRIRNQPESAKPQFIESDGDARAARSSVLKTDFTFDENKYKIDDRFKPATSIEDAHTIPELVRFSEGKQNIDIQAKVLCLTSRESGRATSRGRRKLYSTAFEHRIFNKKQFIETFKDNKKISKHRESFDSFLTDSHEPGLIGDDFIPLLGGPFNKQLYYYDYLRMHATAFHAFHHDPIAKRIVNIMNTFTLGRGFRTDVVRGKDKDKAMALWDAFEEVNNFYQFVKFCNIELSVYGEIMPWKLPNHATNIGYQLRPGQEVPLGLLPRYRLIDPSVIWEIVTYPEDIQRVLYYQWVAPTQYQIYTGMDAGETVPSTKFIMQQIPGDEVLHEKINCVSNEKRGRSDLFAILGYLKRLRDSINYSMISDQKNAAWSIDTVVEGSQTDIDAYVEDQKALGTVPPAGSEFVHSKKVERQYLANAGSSKSMSQSFDWCLSMIAIGAGIPISYLGTHLSGAQARGSSIVSTEPVTKMFEERQLILERLVTKIAQDLFREHNLDAEVEVTFPEIISQDRSAKIKDILVAEQSGYISKERAAAMAAKELGITEYDYGSEMLNVKTPETKPGNAPKPLTAPPALGQNQDQEDTEPRRPSAVTSDERRDIKRNDGA